MSVRISLKTTAFVILLFSAVALTACGDVTSRFSNSSIPPTPALDRANVQLGAESSGSEGSFAPADRPETQSAQTTVSGVPEQAQPESTPAPFTSPTLVSVNRSAAQAPVPTRNPTAVPTIANPAAASQPVTVFKNYIVRRGDNLSSIGSRMGVPISTIMQLNGLRNPDWIYAGQVLRISATIRVGRGPGERLIPDSEVVYSPAYQGFDLNGFVRQQRGYLSSYQEIVEGQSLTGAEILQLVAERFSVGPRVLLTLLELEGGWVTGQPQNNTELYYPMGYANSRWSGLYRQAWFAADKLNEGYYGRVYGQMDNLTLLDASQVSVASGVNPGTGALQDYLAYVDDYKHWIGDIAGFRDTYKRMFGDPFSRAIDPLVPDDIRQPTLQVPWQTGLTWYYTGGPHGGWADGSAWAAVDFAPGVNAGTCRPSPEYAAAAAPGLVVQAEQGRVMVNLEGKNFQGVGWTLMYMHMGEAGRVAVGTRVKTGDLIGHPSCEGGYSEADHLHFARLYNGQWIAAADRKIPMVISGWTIKGGSSQYDGAMARGSAQVDACNCHDAAINGIPWDSGGNANALDTTSGGGLTSSGSRPSKDDSIISATGGGVPPDSGSGP